MQSKPFLKIWLLSTTNNNNGQQPNFRNFFDCINYHLCKISSQIIQWKFFCSLWFPWNELSMCSSPGVSYCDMLQNDMFYRTQEHHRNFIPLFISLWNDLADPLVDGWDWRVVSTGPMFFYWPELLAPFLSSTFLPFSSFFRYWSCGTGASEWSVINRSLPALHFWTYLIVIVEMVK